MSSPNDPNLTAANLKLTRRQAGIYEHFNKATDTYWWIESMLVGKGGTRWTYRRVPLDFFLLLDGGTPDPAKDDHTSEGHSHDYYWTKRDATEALAFYLQGRFKHDKLGWCTKY